MRLRAPSATLRGPGRFLLLTLLATMTIAAACGGDAADDAVPPPAPRAPVAAARQVRVFPHDTAAFTQGLVWHRGALYESTGRMGRSSLRRVKLETGEVLKRVDLGPQYFGEGLAALGERLYQLTWQNGIAFVYDLESFRVVDTLRYEGEGWGLTTDGERLILSDGSSTLRFVDPETFQVMRTLDVKDGGEYVGDLNELEWVKGEVWANVWHSDRIARIDPATGTVTGWIDLAQIVPQITELDPEAVPNGIAYDPAADRLFVTGKLWPYLFEISIPELKLGGGGGADTPGADSARP